MFEQIAKFRREPSDELLDIEHSPSRCGGSAATSGGSREPATFTLLLERHRTAVIHFLFRMVQDRAVAEELALEAFLRIYRASRDSSGVVAQPATRLFRIAADLALKELSDNGSEPPPAPFADAIACMPGKQKAAVLLHKYHQMETWQIARVLDCPETVVRSLLLSAFDRLRRSMAACAAPLT